MSWNTDFTRFKSSDLAALDCGNNIRIPRRDRIITLTAQYTGDLEKGQCVAMVRVPKDARILDVELDWNSASSNTVLAVGDPFACGRFLGPISTALNRGLINHPSAGATCLPWGVCGRMAKVGTNGDGCGRWYQYTCETDIIVTNLDHAGQAAQGGYAGGALTVISPLGAKWTGGALTLTVSYIPNS